MLFLREGVLNKRIILPIFLLCVLLLRVSSQADNLNFIEEDEHSKKMNHLNHEEFVDQNFKIRDQLKVESEDTFVTQNVLDDESSKLMATETDVVEDMLKDKDVLHDHDKHIAERNYASKDCGAKVLFANDESENRGAILNDPERDDYLRNPCKSNKFLVIELCETIQLTSIELANFELFSSNLKDFRLYTSERYPNQEWILLGEFQAQNIRYIQRFQMPELASYTKFIKLDLLSHYGNEHYCTLSTVRVYGISMVDEYEAEASAPISSNSLIDENKNNYKRLSEKQKHDEKELYSKIFDVNSSLPQPTDKDSPKDCPNIELAPSDQNQKMICDQNILSLQDKSHKESHKEQNESLELQDLGRSNQLNLDEKKQIRSSAAIVFLPNSTANNFSSQNECQKLSITTFNKGAQNIIHSSIRNKRNKNTYICNKFLHLQCPSKNELSSLLFQNVFCIVRHLNTSWRFTNSSFCRKFTKGQSAFLKLISQSRKHVVKKTCNARVEQVLSMDSHQPKIILHNRSENVDRVLPKLVVDKVTSPLPGSSTNPKESVFMKLNKRLSQLEMAQSLSSEFLQDLSRRYISQNNEIARQNDRISQFSMETKKQIVELQKEINLLKNEVMFFRRTLIKHERLRDKNCLWHNKQMFGAHDVMIRNFYCPNICALFQDTCNQQCELNDNYNYALGAQIATSRKNSFLQLSYIKEASMQIPYFFHFTTLQLFGAALLTHLLAILCYKLLRFTFFYVYSFCRTCKKHPNKTL